MAGDPLTAFPTYFYAALLFTHSQSVVVQTHRPALSVKAGANVVTAGRTWRGQADVDLDTRKETIFLLCFSSFLPWVHLQAPICHCTLPASIPFLSAPAQKCTGTGEPWPQLNPLLLRFGTFKCTKHPLLTGGNWCEI